MANKYLNAELVVPYLFMKYCNKIFVKIILFALKKLYVSHWSENI